jgi:hypothetical protein
MEFGDLPFAMQLRDVIKSFVRSEVNSMRPAESLATVVSVDREAKRCMVQFPEGGDTIPVKMFTIQPRVGSVVRIEGSGTSRYVAEVVNGNAHLNAGELRLRNLTTSPSGANVFADITTGEFYRASSSRRYKKDISGFVPRLDIFKRLRAVTFKSNVEGFDDTYLGLIAEDIAEFDDAITDTLYEKNEDGEPESVNYDRVAVYLIPILQSILERVEAVESENAQLRQELNRLSPRPEGE